MVWQLMRVRAPVVAQQPVRPVCAATESSCPSGSLSVHSTFLAAGVVDTSSIRAATRYSLLDQSAPARRLMHLDMGGACCMGRLAVTRAVNSSILSQTAFLPCDACLHWSTEKRHQAHEDPTLGTIVHYGDMGKVWPVPAVLLRLHARFLLHLNAPN